MCRLRFTRPTMSSTIAAISNSTPTTMSSAPATVPPAMDLPNAMSASDAVFGVETSSTLYVPDSVTWNWYSAAPLCPL